MSEWFWERLDKASAEFDALPAWMRKDKRQTAKGINLESLRRIAEAADNGNPWEWQGGYPQRIIRVGDVVIVADCFESPDHPSRFAEFIATFDPPLILCLLGLIEGSQNG